MNLEMNLPVMFTPLEAAKILSVSRSQIYVLLKEGELKSVKIGRSRRISQNQLRSYIDFVESETSNVF